MFCKHCGKQIDADAAFCRYCGKPQQTSSQTQQEPRWEYCEIRYTLLGQKKHFFSNLEDCTFQFVAEAVGPSGGWNRVAEAPSFTVTQRTNSDPWGSSDPNT